MLPDRLSLETGVEFRGQQFEIRADLLKIIGYVWGDLSKILPDPEKIGDFLGRTEFSFGRYCDFFDSPSNPRDVSILNFFRPGAVIITPGSPPEQDTYQVFINPHTIASYLGSIPHRANPLIKYVFLKDPPPTSTFPPARRGEKRTPNEDAFDLRTALNQAWFHELAHLAMIYASETKQSLPPEIGYLWNKYQERLGRNQQFIKGSIIVASFLVLNMALMIMPYPFLPDDIRQNLFQIRKTIVYNALNLCALGICRHFILSYYLDPEEIIARLKAQAAIKNGENLIDVIPLAPNESRPDPTYLPRYRFPYLPAIQIGITP